jgi:hypothetical protein
MVSMGAANPSPKKISVIGLEEEADNYSETGGVHELELEGHWRSHQPFFHGSLSEGTKQSITSTSFRSNRNAREPTLCIVGVSGQLQPTSSL